MKSKNPNKESEVILDNVITPKISSLIGLILQDKGKTNIYELAKQLGFTKEVSEIEVPFFLYTLAKFVKDKSMEITTAKITRKDQKQTLETIYAGVSAKLIADTSTPGFQITERYREDLKLLMDLNEKLAKFEGRNRPDKIEVEIKHNIDLKKVTTDEAETMLTIFDKAKIEEE